MWNPLVGDPIIGPMLHTVGLGFLFPVLFVVLGVWAFAWKAAGLWYAARNKQRVWFVVFLLVHTLGILEIVYLKWHQKDKNAEGSNEVFPFLKDWVAKGRQVVATPTPIKEEK